MNRLKNVQGLSIIFVMMLALVGGIVPIMPAAAAVPLDPTTIPKYVTPLTAAIPVYTPTNVLDPISGAIVEQDYVVDVTQFTEQILPTVDALGNPTGFGVTTVWGYGGNAQLPDGTPIGYFRNSPAASFSVTKGIPTKIKWVNNLVDGLGNPLPFLYSVDPTIHWANPNMFNMMDVNQEATMGLAPPYPPGYNGVAQLVGGVWTNPKQWNAQSPVPIVTHVHGAEVPSGSDGGPNEWFTPNGLHGSEYYTYEATTPNSAVYYYPNQQNEATLWYHDHAMGLTRINVFSGLAGYYILTDPAEPIHASIPAALSRYDVPIAIQDRSFNADGSFNFNVDPPPNADVHPYWVPEYFGDTFMVNGNTWPYFNVDQTTYRFRLLDGCNARFLHLTLVDVDNANALVPFTVIARDQGYLQNAVTENNILMGPGMRSEILVDFTGIPAGHHIVMKNDAAAPYPTGNPVVVGLTDQVMQFVVQGTVGPTYPALPAPLNPTLPTGSWPTLPVATRERQLTLTEVQGLGGPLMVLVDGQLYDNTMSELPVQGTTETWVIANPTADAHPMHWHLVQFQLVSRQAFNDVQYLADWEALNGPAPLNHPTINVGNLNSYYTAPATGPDPDETGWLDTVMMPPGYVSIVRVRFTQQDGAAYTFDPTAGQGYVWHCHIVDHEDNDMMRPFKVISAGQLPNIVDAVRGANGEIYYRTYDFGTSAWSAFAAIPGGLTTDTPAAAVYNGNIYFAVRGSDGTSLWFGSVAISTGVFSGWTFISGSTPNAPKLLNYGSKLVLVVRGFNDIVYYRSYDTTTSTWGGWIGIPDAATGDSPAAAVVGNKLNLAIRGLSDSVLYFGQLDMLTSTFSGWSATDGVTSSTPVLVAEESSNALRLVVTGTNNLIYMNRWNGVAWEGWTTLPSGSTTLGPGATVLNNDIYFEVVGSDLANTIYFASLNTLTSTFSGWVAQPGSTSNVPVLTK